MELEIEPAEALEAIRHSRMALVDLLPSDFPLQTLLTFLPDVRLKKRLDDRAAAALAIDVAAEGGLARADAALGELGDEIKATEACFAEPTDLANQLHKRLTGLRSDFTQKGKQAKDELGRRVYAETKRREALAIAARRREQAEADHAVRMAAEAAAKAAVVAEAPAPIIEALKAAAVTATASPVPGSVAKPVLARTSTIEKWVARLAGTPDVLDVNPKMAEVANGQVASVKALMAGVVAGDLPLVVFEINWTLLNRYAAASQRTLEIPGLEAVDVGGIRAKPSQRGR